MPSVRPGAATDQPETTNTNFLPIAEVVWQQPPEININITNQKSKTKTVKNTHRPELKHENDVQSQTSPVKRILRQDSGSNTETFQENHTRNTPV